MTHPNTPTLHQLKLHKVELEAAAPSAENEKKIKAIKAQIARVQAEIEPAEQEDAVNEAEALYS